MARLIIKIKNAPVYIKAALIILLSVLAIDSILWTAGKLIPYYKCWEVLPWDKNMGIKYLTDEDYYTYSVGLPTYLYWSTGNLAIVNNQDAKEEGNHDDPNNNDSIIIWLKPFSNEAKEIGVILTYNGSQHQVYLEDRYTARYPEEQEIVDANREEIDTFYEKACNQWDIEIQ